MNTIVNIGAVDYSGSTVLNCMLANREDSFAAGEVWALLKPETKIQKETVYKGGCSCFNRPCKIWDRFRNKDEKFFFETIFKERKIIVDSSKLIWWYKHTKKYANNVKSVLIFQHPKNLVWGYYKRARTYPLENLQRSFYDYYNDFLKEFPDTVIFSYKDLCFYLTDTVKKIFKGLDISYIKGQEKFWERKFYHLWCGNNKWKRTPHMIYDNTWESSPYKVDDYLMDMYNELEERKINVK